MAKKAGVGHRIEKIADIEDTLTRTYMTRYGFDRLFGEEGYATLPKDEGQDPRKVTAEVLKRGALLPTDPVERGKIIAEVIAKDPKEFWVYPPEGGWQIPLRCFLHGAHVHGSLPGQRSLRAPPWIERHPVGALTCTGSLKGWKKRVAKPSRHSSILILLITIGLAASLVRIKGAPSFAINVYGPRKKGKTTGQRGGASVIGLCRKLPNWNMTQIGYQETVRAWNDLALFIDEMGLILGGPKSIYRHVRPLIYALTDGVDRVRSVHASVQKRQTYSHEFHGIVVSSAEHSLDEYAALAGQTRDDGEYARCTDVPALMPGRRTIFDRPPRHMPRGKRGRWARRTLRDLRKAYEEEHGTPLDTFLDFLMMFQLQELRNQIEDLEKIFLGHVHANKLDDTWEHVARNFALIFAAGCLAIDAKVLPWSRQLVLKAISKCFKVAFAQVETPEKTLQRARRTLELKLKSADIVTPQFGESFGPTDHVGYVETVNGQTRYVVHAKAFRAWFAGKPEYIAILRWLHETGNLHLPKPKVPEEGSSEWAERSKKWPDKNPQKSIVFSMPAPKAQQPPQGDRA